MNYKLYSVFDRQAQTYSNPMFLIAHGQAVRSFSDEINRSAADNPLFNHPDDFDLWFIGEWCTDNAQFSVLTPEVICLGKNVKLNGSSS